MELALRHLEAPLASRDQLCRAHDPDYVDHIFHNAPREGYVRLDSDTLMNPHSLAAARRAAGAVILGVDTVMEGRMHQAFCSVRPPGHHAERRRAMGFCIFNNVAVGAAHALCRHGLQRVAIVDFDVHHGNGTEDIFADDPRVLFCSSFQHPFYPYSGTEADTAQAVHTPLRAGSGGTAFRQAVKERWLPRLEAFAPELIMISAGFDAHAEDEMAALAFGEADYRWVTGELLELARRHARGRIVSTLEGGYALAALGRSVVAHLDALLGNA
ncbi:MAG: histone deacetylase family protein [Gammaproteobacteria bacterium]|nr:histone deacetylase family protein [Gammaproteobacteria bacterium]